MQKESQELKFPGEKQADPTTRFIVMGFDGAAAFQEEKWCTGSSEMLPTRALYGHCHGHLLLLSCVQAANETKGIKCVHHTHDNVEMLSLFSQTLESLKEIHQVLNIPELKVLQPSDTLWLALEKMRESNYPAIVLTLDHINEETHEPEALGIFKALRNANTIKAVYL